MKTSRPPSVTGDLRPKNKLLAALTQECYTRLRPHLRTVPVKVRQVLHPINEPVRDIYFPNGGVVSMTTMMTTGEVTEIAVVGAEGFVGFIGGHGEQSLNGETMMQIPDTDAVVLPAEIFRREYLRDGPFRTVMDRFTQGLLLLIMQSTGCLARHPVRERCCRWLLMAHDRVGRDDFRLSHEFLAKMLGATRPTVTLVASALQRGGGSSGTDTGR